MLRRVSKRTLSTMSLATLVLKNLFRQRVRTMLTVAGIAIGVATVVALGAITGGLKARPGSSCMPAEPT